jgi:hypothetical protein
MTDRESFERNGYAVLKSAIPSSQLDKFEKQVLALIADICGEKFPSLHSSKLATYLLENRASEETLYKHVREYPWLLDVSLSPKILSQIANLFQSEFGVFAKIPLRIDLPLVTRELAIWHQDFHYVRGNIETLTAWIPLQDTPYELGPLMVMPRSHHSGPLDHSIELLGKKQIPSDIFDREIRYVEMNRGDVLLFHSCLLHSSSLNISTHVRFSIQARYSRLDLPVDPEMGALIPVRKESRNEVP